MNVRSTEFRVQEGQKVDLHKWPTAVEPIYESKKQYQKLLKQHVEELSSLQQLLYASSRYAVLLIFQAMDAAGKDGAIRHVMSGVNPQGCQVFSYKHPSAMELQHDFLWRTTRDLPERGRIGIFNRSYYEEVLIVRVHPEILRSEGIAGGSLDEKTVWESRFRSIVGLESHLHLKGTRIVKFYLHLSKDEQRRRFLQGEPYDVQRQAGSSLFPRLCGGKVQKGKEQDYVFAREAGRWTATPRARCRKSAGQILSYGA